MLREGNTMLMNSNEYLHMPYIQGNSTYHFCKL